MHEPKEAGTSLGDGLGRSWPPTAMAVPTRQNHGGVQDSKLCMCDGDINVNSISVVFTIQHEFSYV